MLFTYTSENSVYDYIYMVILTPFFRYNLHVQRCGKSVRGATNRGIWYMFRGRLELCRWSVTIHSLAQCAFSVWSVLVVYRRNKISKARIWELLHEQLAPQPIQVLGASNRRRLGRIPFPAVELICGEHFCHTERTVEVLWSPHLLALAT